MATSILDFWTLICETNCSVVVLVCPLFENDQVFSNKNQFSCKIFVSSVSILYMNMIILIL